MTKLDRDLQLFILQKLEEIAPHLPAPTDINAFTQQAENYDKLVVNLSYLRDHGLIECDFVRALDHSIFINWSVTRISKDGFDFLASDGGLGAILNVVTVKIHQESLAQVEDFLSRALLNPQDKNKYAARLKELPADATKHLFLKLLDLGLANAPAALQLIQKTLGL